MQNYPIFIDLKNQACLVVGGGDVAHRKIRLMRSAHATITVIAPTLTAELEDEFGTQITHIEREFEDHDIGDYRLITAATNDAQVNARVSELAQAANIPVNVVDQPDLCSFITPSIIDRSPVLVAISTGGGAPVLARMLRAKLEAFIPSSYGHLAKAMQTYRQQVKNLFTTEQDRRQFWEKVTQGPIAELFFSGRQETAQKSLQQAIDLAKTQTHTNNKDQVGEVWLVGAGPGDPDLLTFKALRLMQQADVVLYDRLVSEEVVNLTRRDAERIYVGKQRAEHAVPQGQINQLLVDLAQQGKRVVRLKGGDPFIFGRGGEEIELLAQAGIPFQIVPGITAASGCATYAGIPLTHRDHAQSCLFVTGHLKDGSIDLDWQRMAIPNQTVVVYMGLVGLPIICERLIKEGVSPEMPIALIQQGTTQNQQVILGTLASLPIDVEKKKIQAPTLIIIGNVVSLQSKLNWF